MLEDLISIHSVDGRYPREHSRWLRSEENKTSADSDYFAIRVLKRLLNVEHWHGSNVCFYWGGRFTVKIFLSATENKEMGRVVVSVQIKSEQVGSSEDVCVRIKGCKFARKLTQ